MKKAGVILILMLTVFCQTVVFSKDNTIYEINLKSDKNRDIVLNLKSDFKSEIKPVKENEGSVYFDIKNAKLDKNFKTTYSKTNEPFSVVSQQIGSKVRIYLLGEDIDNFHAAFASNKGVNPFEFNKMWIIGLIAAFVSFVALKSYSATMRLTSDNVKVNNPMKTAMNLNRQLYSIRKKPELVLNSTNPVKSGVYVDFNRAKEQKDIKIAI